MVLYDFLNVFLSLKRSDSGAVEALQTIVSVILLAFGMNFSILSCLQYALGYNLENDTFALYYTTYYRGLSHTKS